MDSIQDGRAHASRTTGVGVLDRCVVLLDLLADGPQTLRSLAAASGLPRPTTHRLLIALEAHRLVARDATGAFRLGPRLTELAAVAGPELDLASLAGLGMVTLHYNWHDVDARSCFVAAEVAGLLALRGTVVTLHRCGRGCPAADGAGRLGG